MDHVVNPCSNVDPPSAAQTLKAFRKPGTWSLAKGEEVEEEEDGEKPVKMMLMCNCPSPGPDIDPLPALRELHPGGEPARAPAVQPHGVQEAPAQRPPQPPLPPS